MTVDELIKKLEDFRFLYGGDAKIVKLNEIWCDFVLYDFNGGSARVVEIGPHSFELPEKAKEYFNEDDGFSLEEQTVFVL